MNKKSLLAIFAIIILPLVAFYCLTLSNDNSNVALATDKPQILKFSSTMCLECKQVEKVFKELMPKYRNKINYTEIIVDKRDDMKNALIKKHNVTLVPTIIMLNSDGTQYKRIESALPKDEMEQYIKEMY